LVVVEVPRREVSAVGEVSGRAKARPLGDSLGIAELHRVNWK